MAAARILAQFIFDGNTGEIELDGGRYRVSAVNELHIVTIDILRVSWGDAATMCVRALAETGNDGNLIFCFVSTR